MPVLLDRGAAGQVAIGGPESALRDFPQHRRVALALVNNMPDAALDHTERQFTQLLAAASGSEILVHVRLFSLPGVPRSGPAVRRMAETGNSLHALLNSRADALIVTGTEPHSAALNDEPYWHSLAELVDWAGDNTVAAIWSCLAAHAAVLHADAIRRTPLREKCFGVFDCAEVSDHPLLAGVSRPFSCPHSRRNDLPEDALAASGYVILTRARGAGVDSFAKRMARSTFLLFQGHPEYDGDSLYREYRRDVARYVRRERDACPNMPAGYFAPAVQERMAAFMIRARALREESLLSEFPAAEPEMPNPWRETATLVYRNWLSMIVADKSAAALSSPRRVTRETVRLATPRGDAPVAAQPASFASASDLQCRMADLAPFAVPKPHR
jgi:homoserine O-succinyltransferase